MIKFNTTILKFAQKGEKTGWSYIEISAAQAKKLKPDNKVSFRVKGTLDQFAFEKLALIPMGEGNFILPMNSAIRKAIGKKHGDKVTVAMEADNRELKISHDLMICLKDDPMAMEFFSSLPKSHQHYFSKWIESAKTSGTKAKRIAMAMIAFSKRQGYSEMMRENKTIRY
jgi:hypothetical protein